MTTTSPFLLPLPEGWRDTTVHTFEGAIDGGITHNLVLVVEPSVTKGTTVAEYAAQQLGTTREALPGFSLIAERDIALESGVDAHEVVYRYIPAEGLEMFQKQVYLIIDGTGFTFTATFTKRTLQTIGADVDRMIASFRPLRPDRNGEVWQ